MELVFVDRFNGALILNGSVADVESAVRDVMDVLEHVMQFTPTVVTKT